MNNNEFISRVKEMVEAYANKNAEDKSTSISKSDIYVVWQCKILKNNKALLATNLPDKMYYEVTYDGTRNSFYLDAYKKVSNHEYHNF